MGRRSLWVELTGECNWQCSFCYNDWRSDASRAPAVLPWPRMHRALNRLLDRIDFEFVAFSGGEPLMSTEIDAAIAWAHDASLYPIITTNGTFLTRKRASELAALGLRGVQISLVSIDEAVHNSVVGTRGWKATLRGVQAALENGLETTVVVTVHGYNSHSLLETAVFLNSLGVHRVVFNDLQVAGSAQENSEALRSPSGDLGDWKATLALWSQTASIIVEFSPAQVDRESEAPQPWHRWTVGPDGGLRLCNVTTGTLGNLESMSDDYLEQLASDLESGRIEGYSSAAENCGCFARRVQSQQAAIVT